MQPAKPFVVYFHGVPGAPVEARWLSEMARQHGWDVFVPDRFFVDPALRGEAYFRELARLVAVQANGRSAQFIGFSMGAFVALQTSRFLGGYVSRIHLVSAAAPLDGGDFVDALAGKHVFRLAQRLPLLFRVLSRWQGVLARLAPGALFGMLFASAKGADVPLAQDPSFRVVVQDAMRSAFGRGLQGYCRDVLTYVQPWSNTLAAVRAPVHIWQGDADNWSAPAMADYLRAALPNVVRFHSMPGLSHYSCLLAALPMLDAQETP